MVHIPLLGIEVPEPRIAQLVPDFVEGLLRLCTKGTDAAMDATHPLPTEVQEDFMEEYLERLPREVKKVFQRAGHGKHKNEDVLSSELEDAAFDYYRRMIRTAAVGATEEDQEDVTAYKLGLDRPSTQLQVWDQYRQEHAHDLLPGDAAEAAAMAVHGTPEEREEIESALAAARQRLAEAEQLQAVRMEDLRSLKGRIRDGSSQSITTAAHAGMGLVLGIGLIKGVSMLAQQLLRMRKPKSKKTRKVQQPARQASSAGTSSAPTPRGQATQQTQPDKSSASRVRTSTRKR